MNDLITRARAWVASPGYADLSIRQCAVLGILCDDEGPHTVRGVAAQINSTKPVITRVMNAFETMGFARRVPDIDDKRSVFLVATELGRQMRAEIGGIGA